MSRTWTPKPGDECPPQGYTQTGPHAFVDPDELTLRREAWHAMNNAPPPDPPNGNASVVAASEASEEEEADQKTLSEADAAAPSTGNAHGPAPDQYAIDWAFEQDTAGPGPKLVLVVLARHCFEPGDTLAWPSATEIGEKASMRRTAVLENLKRLEASGLIHDSGKRRGRTGQVIVWRLGSGTESEPFNNPESVPFKRPESEPLGGKGSGIRRQRVRNPDTEYPLKGGGGGAAGAAAGAAAAAPIIDLPHGLDAELFGLWVDGRPERAVRKLIAEGRVLAAGGADLNDLCRRAIRERWKMWPKVAASSKTRVAAAERQTHAADDWAVV